MRRADTPARMRAGIPALQPLSWLYGAGMAVSRAAGLRRRGKTSPGTRIISVGNLEVGGSGKTPLAILLLEAAVAEGRRAAYVSRGYGSAAARGAHVTLVTAEDGSFPGAEVGLRILDRSSRAWIERGVGDEAALVTERVPRAMVAVGRDKPEAVALVARLGAEVVIVDDAFQSWSVARDVDVVMLDAEQPLGSGRLLPAGTLREGPGALRRAGTVVFNGAADAASLARARQAVAQWLRPDVRVLGLRRSVEVVFPEQEAGAPARTAFVAAGIARPERLQAELVASGIVVLGSRSFPDHHAYGAGDVARIQAEARAAGAAAVLTTEKDWVKLRRFDWAVPVAVVRLRVELSGASPQALLFA